MFDLTPRQNFRRLVDGETGAWIPFSLDVGSQPGFSGPVMRVFHQRTGGTEPAAHFDADVRCCSLAVAFGGDDPHEFHEALPAEVTFDEWGNAHWAGGDEGTVDHMLPAAAFARTVRDLERLPAPRIQPPDLAKIEVFHAAGYPVFGYAGSVYEWSWWLRGMEQFLMDLVSDPAMAEAVIQKIAAHTARLALASARAGIDVLCFYDDAGMQTGMQISPALWRRFIKPAWRQVLDCLRSESPEVRFFLHSCGQITAIVADIVELGFHILHPIQPECMDFARIHREFGGRILLAASVSSQRTFPFGSPEDVRREVRRLAEIVGPSRRAILMPSNVIQPETPWENVVAFAEEARAIRAAGAR